MSVVLPQTKVVSLGSVVASSQELLDIPTSKPIESVVFEYNIEDTNLLDVDVISEQFDSIIVRFDGDEIYKIENYADLMAVLIEHDMPLPEIVVQRDTVTGDVDNLYMRIELPIRWQKGISEDVFIELNYASTVNTSPTRQARVYYVNAPTWSERFVLSKNPKSASSGAILDFKPAVGEIVRSLYIYLSDNSALTPSTIRFPCSAYGGLIGYDTFEFSHKSVDYYSQMNETEALTLLQKQFPEVFIPSRDIANLELDVNYPFNYLQDHSTSTDGQPVKTEEGIFVFPMQDITSDSNTLFRVNLASDGDLAGSFGASDLCTAVWVYKVPNPSTETK